MTKNELLAAADRMGLSLGNLATLLGMHRATIFRYAKGELKIPQRTALAIAALEPQLKQAREDMEKQRASSPSDLVFGFGTTPLKPQHKRRR